jgi:hypothetical protein
MSAKQFFEDALFVTTLIVTLCVTPAAEGRGGGGGGGGHGGGGGFGGGHGGGGGFGGGHGGGGGFSGSHWSGGGGTYSGARSFAGSSSGRSGGQFGQAGGTAYSVNRPYSFNSGNAGTFHHDNWNAGQGNWYGHHDWDHYFGRGGYGGWGLGLGLGLGYPYDCGYDYPDAGDYYYTNAPTSYVGTGAAVDPVVAAPQQLPVPSEAAPTISADGQQGASEALQYYSEARAAFVGGDYQNALRLASHAAVESPGNPKAHELISLALFAAGNYRAAASEAHAAMGLGPIAQWNDLYGYYNDVNKYTTQLRALEKAATDKPNSAAEHFLLGYHYLMTGARDNAKAEFADAVKLAPGDKLAGQYLQQLQSNSPLAPPQMTSKLRAE